MNGRTLLKKFAQLSAVGGLCFFGYWAIIDYSHLMASTGRLAHNRDEMTEREFQYQVSLDNAYRINTGFDGVFWLLTLIFLVEVSKLDTQGKG